ncbi:phosphatase PAP2 family protein [Rhizobium sp. CRIBSB]|nr:phosphatase PAP2 family protein [Rhizobium sp. CRIBSB]
MADIGANLGSGGWVPGAVSRPGQARPRLIRGLTRAVARLRLLVRAPSLNGPIVFTLAGILVTSLLFLVLPGLDTGTSTLFHAAGAGFPLSQSPLLKALRKSSDVVQTLLVLALLSGLIWSMFAAGRLAVARRCGFLLAALALGPGLVVNGVLKAWWGRPRPVQVDLYGGDAPYQPVWKISDWCQSNCSFVSGEASASLWIVLAVVVLTPARWRLPAGLCAGVYALCLSVNRIAFGGHFLSDVVLSWLISALVFTVLYRLMVAAPGAARRARSRSARPGAYAPA